MRLSILFLLTIGLCCEAQVPSLVGNWDGSLIVTSELQLPINLHLKSLDGKTYTATVDSPSQSANDIPVKQVTLEGSTLKLDIEAIHGTYEGKFDATFSTVSGTWVQNGRNLPLTFHKSQLSLYTEEIVSYQNASAPGVVLAGTLTKPAKGGPFAVALLIPGSGPHDRDETILGHKPFLVIANDLASRGIATLRYDDRGVGRSKGNLATATTQDLASDVVAGVLFLLTRPDVNKKHIGLIGHSEGGIIAPMVAGKMSVVSFLVLLAGSAVPGDQILMKQSVLIEEAGKAPPDLIKADAEIRTKMYDLVRQDKHQAELSKALDAYTAAYPKLAEGWRNQLSILELPWMRYFLEYDPAPALAQMKCPVLALFGSKDLQISPDQNVAPMKAAFARGGNRDATVRVLPGLNHLFQTAQTGTVAEYATISEAISREALDAFGPWIVAHTK